jgi:tetratricopeptide (TPR) repeat protein
MHWQEALDKDIDDALRREVSFKLAEACFKTNDFQDALRRYNLVAADGQDRHLKDQSYIRIGSIFQLQGEHDKAIRAFANVLDETDCPHCRLQAQLGLIESYEHLDRLPEAIEIAEQISDAEYPTAMREELLGRLTEKRKYYEPSLRK